MRVPEVRKSFFSSSRKLSILGIILAWLLVELVILIPAGFGQTSEPGEEHPPSNEEFMRQSARSLFEGTFGDFPEAGSGLLLLRSEREHPANWLLEEELVSFLLSMKWHVALRSGESESGSAESASLFYRIIDMRLDYPRIQRQGFLGRRMVNRKAYLNLSFRLEGENTGKVLWTKRGEHESSDLIRRSTIKSLNNESYSFLSPSLPDDPQSRFLEPALAAVVVGGLIYLFFASR